MNKQTIGIVLAIVALAFSVGGYFHVAVPSFGGITNYNQVDTDVLRIGGTNGTRLAYLNTGTCSLIANNFTVAATSTVPMDCAVTGVVSGDGVFAQFATSTATQYGGWQIRGASASTTAGFVTISVVNGTGSSGVVPASTASSTKYIILRGTTTATGL